MTATGWTDDVVDLPLTYSFAYHVAGDGGEQAPVVVQQIRRRRRGRYLAAGDGGEPSPVVVQQIRGRDLASSSSFSPSAGNGSVVLSVHDVWGGTALASEPLRVVPVKLDTALVGSVLAQIDDLSAEALASNSSQGNAAATQLVGALAATLNTQGEESKADGNASGVTDTALVELREGLFAVLASGQVPIAIIAPPAAQ